MSKHPLAGKTVKIKSGTFAGEDYRVEDWWRSITGDGWMTSAANGNPAAAMYYKRTATDKLPLTDDVVYGKIGPFGHLIHDSELEYPTDE